ICAIYINFLPADKRPQRWGYRQWHFSVRLIFSTIARQRLMNFQPVRAIWFSGVFYWLVDNLHTRPNRNIIKQIFDIVIAQTNTALTYPEPNTKIGIGTMDGIQPANINRVQPHGIIGARRNKCGQTLPSFRIFAPSVRRWRPGWSFLFTFNGSHPVTRGFSPSLADTNRKDFHSITVWWVVIKTHLSDVNNNPFTNSGGQNQLLR